MSLKKLQSFKISWDYLFKANLAEILQLLFFHRNRLVGSSFVIPVATDKKYKNVSLMHFL